jgi:DNA modification methylase
MIMMKITYEIESEVETDLFGDVIEKDPILRERFIEPPFSVLDTKTGSWQKRKQQWVSKGISSEVGRSAKAFSTNSANFAGKEVSLNNTSIFDPALCEVIYKWFCPEGGSIIDPFSGGSVRGIVANYLGFKYTGIDIRQEQIDSNREQAAGILAVNNQPNWYVGDSNDILEGMSQGFDFVFSCPPYADLEVYSDLEGDISNMSYSDFMEAYQSIIKKSCGLLKCGGYACFVVGEVRDKNGIYLGFVPDTIKAFTGCGMEFYNEAILLNMIGTAMMRVNGSMRNQKLVKVHQNVLVFRKPHVAT